MRERTTSFRVSSAVRSQSCGEPCACKTSASKKRVTCLSLASVLPLDRLLTVIGSRLSTPILASS